MRPEPKTLREFYNLYNDGKLLRKNMIGELVTAIEALQARIGAVDEAAVAALDKRLMGLEVGIGNALTAAMHGKYLPASGDIPTTVKINHVRRDEVAVLRKPAPKRRGRPPRKAAEPSPPMNEMGV